MILGWTSPTGWHFCSSAWVCEWLLWMGWLLEEGIGIIYDFQWLYGCCSYLNEKFKNWFMDKQRIRICQWPLLGHCSHSGGMHHHSCWQNMIHIWHTYHNIQLKDEQDKTRQCQWLFGLCYLFLCQDVITLVAGPLTQNIQRSGVFMESFRKMFVGRSLLLAPIYITIWRFIDPLMWEYWGLWKFNQLLWLLMASVDKPIRFFLL